MSDGSIRDLALEYVKSTLSAVPIKADGSKSPVGAWKKYQEHLPSPYDIKQNFKGTVGIAILGGKVSGNLEIIDFDHPDYIEPWVKVVEENAVGLTAKLTRIKTPRGGAHFYYRCPEIEGNQKLAQEPTVDSTTGKPGAKVLIETRGEGGYVLAPGCPAACHPTGKIYEYVSGPKLTEIVTITPEERKVLLDCARSFNRIPKQVKVYAPGGRKSGKGGLRPGDDFNMRATWEEVLVPHGWKPVKKQGEAVHWCRPGKEGSTSATTGHCGDNFYVFSSNAHPFEPDTAYSKFSAYTVLAHNGDFEAAAKDLGGKGYGTKPEKKERRRDRGNADRYFEGREFLPERLAMELADKHEFIATPISNKGIGIWLNIYENGVFRKGAEDLVVTEARAALGEYSNKERLTKVTDNLLIAKKIHYEELNPQALDLINVKNGMLDWKTKKLLPHDKKYLSNIQINANWDPDAKCEAMDKFFETILPADEIPLIEEFMGYLLIPDTSFGKCLVAVGEGGNGKSSFLKLLTTFIGKDNISNFSLHQIAEERFSAAGLFGKLANFYDELESKAFESTGVFKQIVTGDSIKAEEKNERPFSFRPFCRLVFATNQMPRATDRSQAYFDRFIFARFMNRIRDSAIVIRKYDEVLAATPGALSRLLTRSISGLQRLMDRGKFSHSNSSLEAIEDYRRECNSAYDFVKDCCTFNDPTGWISRRSFYDTYKAWSVDQGRKPMSSREFIKVLRGLNVRETRHGEGIGWGGISWSNGTTPETSQKEVENFSQDTGKGHSDLDF